MPTIQPPSLTPTLAAGGTRRWPRHRVKIKPSWSASWLAVDYLECVRFNEAAAPTVPSAQFIYHAGWLKREDRSALEIWRNIHANHWFVRVELLADDRPAEATEPGNAETMPVIYQWTGIILHNAIDFGASGSAGETAAPLDQEMVAYGIEYRLDLCPVIGSIVLAHGGGSVYSIATSILFNQRLAFGLGEVGNRSAVKRVRPDADGKESYVFDGGVAGVGAAQPWTLYDAVEYLLLWITPAEPFLSLGGQAEQLRRVVLPAFDVSGMTVRQALNALIHPSLGLGWCVRWPQPQASDTGQGIEGGTPTFIGDDTPSVAGSGGPEIHVFTTTDVPIKLSDVEIEGNPEFGSIDLRERIDVVTSRVVISEEANYGTIVVSGERILVCCSLSIPDGTLAKAWADGEETAYKNATGFATAEAKDAARRGDILRHVYATFRVPVAWDYKAGNGQGSQKQNANPAIFSDGILHTSASAGTGEGGAALASGTQAPIRQGWGRTFERDLPFVEIADVAQMKQDWRKPLVVFPDPLNAGKWIQSDAIPAHLVMLDQEFGLRIDASPNHKIAKGSADGITTTTQPKFDYRQMIATVAFRTDARLQVISQPPIPQFAGETSDVPGGPELYAQRVKAMRERVCHIEVPGAELWYVVPQTVINIRVDTGNEGSLQHHLGGAVRDDGPKLRRVAAGASAWFGRTRRSLQLVVKDLVLAPRVGSYVSSIIESPGHFAVNSIITLREMNLAAMTATINTEFQELNFGARSGNSLLTRRQSKWRT